MNMEDKRITSILFFLILHILPYFFPVSYEQFIFLSLRPCIFDIYFTALSVTRRDAMN
jgi:hypothetical protein